MKKIMMVAMALIVASSVCFADNSDYKNQVKELKEKREISKKELNEKATKDARKQAKKLEKEGWKVAPGALPLEKQLNEAYLMQMEKDANYYPKFIMAEAKSIGQSYDAAKKSAISLAQSNLASTLQTEIAGMIDNTVANKQMEAGEAASIVEVVEASKNLFSQSLGRMIPVTECYREIKKTGNVEVLVRLAYNSELAKQAAKKIIEAELAKKGQDLHDQLNKALGF